MHISIFLELAAPVKVKYKLITTHMWSSSYKAGAGVTNAKKPLPKSF